MINLFFKYCFVFMARYRSSRIENCVELAHKQVNDADDKRSVNKSSMTKIILILATIFLTTTCLAVTKIYPNVLAPEEEDGLMTLDGLQNIYSRIYTDTHNEDVTEIMNRVGQHGTGFGEELTEREKSILQELGVPNLSQRKMSSLDEQVKTSVTLAGIHVYEKDLLRLENNLARRNGLRSIFRNSTSIDSPFDLIIDLHGLDEVFHGEKFEEQKPDNPFFLEYEKAQKEYQEEGEYDYVLEVEPWQDQREENLKKLFSDFVNKKYSDWNRSLSGHLFWVKAVLLPELVNMSLVGTIANTGLFEPATEAVHSGGSGMGIFPSNVAPPDKTPLESEKVKEEQSGNKYAAFVQKIGEAGFLELNELGGMDSPQVLLQSELDEIFQEEEFTTKMREFKENSELEIEDKEERVLSKIIANFNEDLWSFLEQLREMNRIFKEDLLIKQQN